MIIEDIMEAYAAAAFSQSLLHHTYEFINKLHANCIKTGNGHPLFNYNKQSHSNYRYVNYDTQFCFLSRKNFANSDYLFENEKIKLDISLEQSKPEFWIEKYESYIKCKRKLGRVPDTGMFVMSKTIYDRLSYVNEIKDLINKEDVIIH